MDENNEQFVAYFLPTPETMTKRKEDIKAGIEYREDDELVAPPPSWKSNEVMLYDHVYVFFRYEYKLTREYNWNVKNKASKGYEVSWNRPDDNFNKRLCLHNYKT